FQTGTGSGDHDTLDLSALLSGYSASQAASHVRFQYDDGQSSLASAGSPHSDNGDVTVQVNLSGNTWTNVAVLHDTGANLTSGSDAIQMILNSTQGVQTYHV
ncbi:MAG: type I secretion C-terminal target domain-containing protein, partial [Afipia sp.]|nr:type I secretion C-terminal target domain-containing protein [Afipia sp.]